MGLTGFSYVVDKRIGVMIRINLPNYIHWYVRQIALRLKTRPWAALRLFILMPFSLLRAGIIIPAFCNLFIIRGALLEC